MDVDVPSERSAADSLSDTSSHSTTSDGASASAESTAEENPPIYIVQDAVGQRGGTCHVDMDLMVLRRHLRLTRFPVKRLRRVRRMTFSEPSSVGRHMSFDRRIHSLSSSEGRSRSKSCWSPRLETLFELPYLGEDNVVVFTKPQKLRKSVDEVDQLMKNLDLRKDKPKET